MQELNSIEGYLQAQDLKFALVATRFNDFIVDKLRSGAVDCLVRHGASMQDLTLIKVPGAFELPVVVKKLARKEEYDGIICLGAVIRGATPHFEYVASQVTKGLAQISLDLSVAVGYGILTTDTLEQAVERAGSKAGNKGVEAAQAVMETARVLHQL